MSDKKDAKENSQQTLITLDQLSQTLEVMTCVVERLKQNLNRQLSLTAELFEDEENLCKVEARDRLDASKKLKEDSFVVEISQQELDDGPDSKTVH